MNVIGNMMIMNMNEKILMILNVIIQLIKQFNDIHVIHFFIECSIKYDESKILTFYLNYGFFIKDLYFQLEKID